MAKAAQPALALGKIDLEERSLELRLRLKGKRAVDFSDYLAAYGEAHGPIEAEHLAQSMLGAFMDADRGFQAWRRAAAKAAEA